MCSRSGAHYLLTALAMLTAAPAAANILPLEDQRYVLIACREIDSVCKTSRDLFAAPLPRFAEFNGSAGAFTTSANQTSRIDQTTFSGRGSTWTDGGGGSPGESRFQIVFSVDQPSSYVFRGTLASSWQLIGQTEYRWVDMPDERNASLLGGSVKLFATDDVEFATSGVLVPGELYVVSVWNRNRGQQFYSGSWDFTFTTALVPEPSQMACVGLVLLGLHARRRTR